MSSSKAGAKVAASCQSPTSSGGRRTLSLRELEEDEPQDNVRDENPRWSLFDQLPTEQPSLGA